MTTKVAESVLVLPEVLIAALHLLYALRGLPPGAPQPLSFSPTSFQTPLHLPRHPHPRRAPRQRTQRLQAQLDGAGVPPLFALGDPAVPGFTTYAAGLVHAVSLMVIPGAANLTPPPTTSPQPIPPAHSPTAKIGWFRLYFEWCRPTLGNARPNLHVPGQIDVDFHQFRPVFGSFDLVLFCVDLCARFDQFRASVRPHLGSCRPIAGCRPN